MLSVQMGRAGDTCSIKGIRGDLTTSLSASWPHIDQPVWDHSQPVWQLNLGPAHAQTLSFTHAHTLTHWYFIYYRVMWIYSGFSTGVSMFICLSHVSRRRKSKRRKEEVLGDWIGFIHRQLSSHENKWLSVFQFPGETCRNQIARIELKSQSGVQA